jgi:hypothetical protein
MWRITRGAATTGPIVQGRRLTLRNALKVVLSSEFPRSPMARLPLWALLAVFCSSVSAQPEGFLVVTVEDGLLERARLPPPDAGSAVSAFIAQ